MDQGLKDQLAGIFGRMEKKVTIRAVADLSREKDREMASFLRAIVSVSPNLELELYGPDEADQVPELNTAWLPVTGLYKDGAYGRAAFHGVPGGREINSFVLAVYNLAGPGQEACQQIAILNPNIEAEMIDAALYDDLVAQYDIKRVPMMIINDSRIVMGSKTMDEIVTLLK